MTRWFWLSQIKMAPSDSIATPSGLFSSPRLVPQPKPPATDSPAADPGFHRTTRAVHTSLITSDPSTSTATNEGKLSWLRLPPGPRPPATTSPSTAPSFQNVTRSPRASTTQTPETELHTSCRCPGMEEIKVVSWTGFPSGRVTLAPRTPWSSSSLCSSAPTVSPGSTVTPTRLPTRATTTVPAWPPSAWSQEASASRALRSSAAMAEIDSVSPRARARRSAASPAKLRQLASSAATSSGSSSCSRDFSAAANAASWPGSCSRCCFCCSDKRALPTSMPRGLGRIQA
mmetsp:Transcript_23070/g.56027  ORF Transcript_23070/g.56027 Transcript_23070/m.56027 type:complete len:287 (-) Transcript_23070:7-867(-)